MFVLVAGVVPVSPDGSKWTGSKAVGGWSGDGSGLVAPGSGSGWVKTVGTGVFLGGERTFGAGVPGRVDVGAGWSEVG